MGRLSMGRQLSRGAVAALISIAFTGALAAQTVTARRVPRDTVMVRAFGVGQMDTILVLARALAHEQYGSPAWFDLSRKLDSLTGMSRLLLRRADGTLMNSTANLSRGWLGFNAQGPSLPDGDRVTYFDYPQILSVDPDSPADRAGIVPGDVLVAFNGTDVIGHEFNLSRLIVPDKKVSVTVRRDGEMKDFALEIGKVPRGVLDRRVAFSGPVMPLPPGVEGTTIIRIGPDDDGGRGPGGGGGARIVGGQARGVGAGRVVIGRGGNGPMGGVGFVIIAPHAVFGADVSTVGADLARALKIEKGVLVNDVPEASVAYKSGLRVGDVITNVSGQSVAALGQLQDIIVSHFADRSVILQVMRDRKLNKITVTW
jgi:membrane-associated protease RseP (regulator of RpoE activity)